MATEGIDYELVPFEESSDHWAVRILTGDFVETIIRFDAIAANETAGHLSFNFSVMHNVESEEIVTESNVKLQKIAGEILNDILEKGIEGGYIDFKEKAK